MKRLTERIRENEYATGNAIIKELKIDENNKDKSYISEQQKNIINTLNNKLGKLEDLEEQLGCPLDVREKALDNGFYDIDGNYYTCEHYVPYLKEMHTRGIMSHTEKHFKLKDYKKTWWLKEDKSE